MPDALWPINTAQVRKAVRQVQERLADRERVAGLEGHFMSLRPFEEANVGYPEWRRVRRGLTKRHKDLLGLAEDLSRMAPKPTGATARMFAEVERRTGDRLTMRAGKYWPLRWADAVNDAPQLLGFVVFTYHLAGASHSWISKRIGVSKERVDHAYEDTVNAWTALDGKVPDFKTREEAR
jgi:hypothetical protein